MTNDENKEIRGIKVSELQDVKCVHLGTFTCVSRDSYSSDVKYDAPPEFFNAVVNTDLPFYKDDHSRFLLLADFVVSEHGYEYICRNFEFRINRVDYYKDDKVTNPRNKACYYFRWNNFWYPNSSVDCAFNVVYDFSTGSTTVHSSTGKTEDLIIYVT